MGERILVVDDEPVNRELVRAILEEDGYQFIEASDGLKGIAEARAGSPDLVLLDLLMPGMNGLEVCRHLKTASDTADIPIIVITAVGQLPAKEAALARGVDDFLTKPVKGPELRARVAALLRARHIHHELDRLLAYRYELECTRLRERQMTLSQAIGTRWPALPPDAEIIRLLLVVDDELTLRTYSALLTEHAFQVIPTAGDADGLAEAELTPFDIALVDTQLTGTTWIEVLRRLQEAHPGIPVFMLITHPMAQQGFSALKLGATDLIVKGWDHNLVALALHRTARLTRELRQAHEEIEQLRARVGRREPAHAGTK